MSFLCYTNGVNTGRNVMTTFQNFKRNARSYAAIGLAGILGMGCDGKGGGKGEEPTPITPDGIAIAQGAKINVDFGGRIDNTKENGVDNFFDKINIAYSGFSAQLGRDGRNFSVELENAKAHQPDAKNKGYFTALDESKKASLSIKSLDVGGFGVVNQKKVIVLRILFDTLNTNISERIVGERAMGQIMKQSIENHNEGKRPNALQVNGLGSLTVQ